MDLLFDLDGTLTDSRDGIVRCYQHALAELGRAVPPASDLGAFVGPPLASCFRSLLQTDDCETIERAVASYRRRYEERGMFENSLYPGIADALAALAHEGHRLYVVTAKPASYATRILEHFTIDAFFQAVYGPEMGQRYFDKGMLVETALKTSAIPPEVAYMAGDRSDDVAAAKENGVHAIGVTWGYGGRDELIQSGADVLIQSPSDLVAYIRSTESHHQSKSAGST
jgi:phosphoglycolate phosphatase